MGRLRRPVRGFHAELLGVLGVQALPARELRGIATSDAADGSSAEKTIQNIETKVTRVEALRALEYGDTRWELEASGTGTRLTLWAKIDRRFISMGAAGWHVCLDVLDRLLGGTPIGRMAGPQTMKFEGWQRLKQEYARQFGTEAPNQAPKDEKKS